jgi:hypothetical protein
LQHEKIGDLNMAHDIHEKVYAPLLDALNAQSPDAPFTQCVEEV